MVKDRNILHHPGCGGECDLCPGFEVMGSIPMRNQ
jgi:hypothetical protein